jgi:hypothetical protein
VTFSLDSDTRRGVGGVSPDPGRAGNGAPQGRVDDQVHVWSASPVTWRMFERLGIPAGRETRFPGGAVSGRF